MAGSRSMEAGMPTLEMLWKHRIMTWFRDRTEPSGYKVSLISFANGEPVAPANSNTSYTDIFANADNSACPGNCFRPVGLAFDSQGRMFVSSDASGEIYVVVRDETANSTTGSGSSGSSSGGKPKSGAQRQAALSITALALSVVVWWMIS